MDFLEQYMNAESEIIGYLPKDEEQYDREVLRWLRKGKGITKAIKRQIKNIQKGL